MAPIWELQMGNCTSKKSAESLKLKKKFFKSKMEGKHENHLTGLTKKVAPFTKGEITSFGFKKKASHLPLPVTLTSNSQTFRNHEENSIQNSRVVFRPKLNDQLQNGNCIEPVSHAPFKPMRKKDSDCTLPEASLPIPNEYNGYHISNSQESNSELQKHRFGFRQQNSSSRILESDIISKEQMHPVSRISLLTGLGPQNTGSFRSRKSEFSSRAKSEGPREEFFKGTLQTANSVQSGVNQSKQSLVNISQNGKFTLQTSQLPRPQFPVKWTDTKMAKTATNYYRKDIENEANLFKNRSYNENSAVESYSRANHTSGMNTEKHESNTSHLRRPRHPRKKLEMKIIGNKFELLKKEEENGRESVTEISYIKLPASNARTNIGLVEQRTNQYLQRISQPFITQKETFTNCSNSHIGETLFNKNKEISQDSKRINGSNLGCEKSFKDIKKSEKYLMSNECYETDELLPGEAMAEDESFCVNTDEDVSKLINLGKRTEARNYQPEIEVTPNTIRLDALKLSRQLQSKNLKFFKSDSGVKKDEKLFIDFLSTSEKDDETFPNGSIFEQLSSSDSDSIGDKNENKIYNKEKNVKKIKVYLKNQSGLENVGIECYNSKTETEENSLDVNANDSPVEEGETNCLVLTRLVSPGTSTHPSRSTSLSDGRDFLIDDEIADQPQLCFSENYIETGCQEEGKTFDEKVVTTENEILDSVACIATYGRKHNVGETLEIPIKQELGCSRRNSEGTLSPCESIVSDDLILDFDTNSFNEIAERADSVNEVISFTNKVTVNTVVNTHETFEEVREKNNYGQRNDMSKTVKDGNSGSVSPKSNKSLESSPSFTKESNDDYLVKLEKVSYQNLFEDVVGMKTMLIKLRSLLIESEESPNENGEPHPDDETMTNIKENELTDLRRQVLFLQQQLEEREKTVQVLKSEMTKTVTDFVNPTLTIKAQRQCNAATQTGLDQCQKEFTHFRLSQTMPVV